jgi:alpha-beta hydrolase superfamily lysophospholipase
MSVDAQAKSAGSNTHGPAEALYFESSNHKLFGWLHTVPGEAAGIGLVICKPFGYEAICSHRGTRAFAEAAAAVGVPTLRFDYRGTGDSADIDTRADQLEIWSRDVLAAVAELRRRTGVERVCLLGIRLGALIATLAATQDASAVNGLVLIAPVISGRRYVRELRTTRLAAMMGAEPAESESGAPADVQAAPAGSMEVSGYSLSPATLNALSQIDLTQLSVRPAPDVLIIDGGSLPVSRGWSQLLSGQDVRTDYQTLPGLVEMLITAPQFAKIPHEMITATCNWLPRLKPGSTHSPILAAGPHPLSRAAGQPNALTLPGDSSAPHASMSERPVFFGSEAAVFGIVTEPHLQEKRRRAVILLNAGADCHIGASRMYVDLARRWARRGYVVLRMDLAGLGDSGTRPGRLDDEVFPPAAMEDVRAAIEFLRTHYAVRETTIAGLCSGAYHALRAAAAEIPVNRILMINPQNFFWKEGRSVNDAELVRNPGLYRARVFSWGTWKRLFAGRLNIAYISNILGNRLLLGFESTLRDWARRLRLHLPGDLGWELERIAARGVRVVFVFARGEPGIELLRIQAGSSVERVGARCRVHILDHGDHVFSRSGSRSVLEGVLDTELFGQNPWEGVPNAR